jgi:hypothetical protein
MSDAKNPVLPAKALLKEHGTVLARKTFIVTVDYAAHGTRWIEHDKVILMGLQKRINVFLDLMSDGKLPLVTVTESKP